MCQTTTFTSDDFRLLTQVFFWAKASFVSHKKIYPVPCVVLTLWWPRGLVGKAPV